MAEPVAFYADAHIPLTVVQQLREVGAEVIRCQEVGLTDAADEAHFEYAIEHGLVIITCDRDFEDYAWKNVRQHWGILYCLQRDCRPGVILENALYIFEKSNKEEMRGFFWRV